MNQEKNGSTSSELFMDKEISTGTGGEGDGDGVEGHVVHNIEYEL